MTVNIVNGPGVMSERNILKSALELSQYNGTERIEILKGMIYGIFISMVPNFNKDNMGATLQVLNQLSNSIACMIDPYIGVNVNLSQLDIVKTAIVDMLKYYSNAVAFEKPVIVVETLFVKLGF